MHVYIYHPLSPRFRTVEPFSVRSVRTDSRDQVCALGLENEMELRGATVRHRDDSGEGLGLRSSNDAIRWLQVLTHKASADASRLTGGKKDKRYASRLHPVRHKSRLFGQRGARLEGPHGCALDALSACMVAGSADWMTRKRCARRCTAFVSDSVAQSHPLTTCTGSFKPLDMHVLPL